MSDSEEQVNPPTRNSLALPFRSLFNSIAKLFVLLLIAIKGAFQHKVVRFGLPVLLVAIIGGWYLLNNSNPSVQPTTDNSADVMSIQASQTLPQPIECGALPGAQANSTLRVCGTPSARS